MKQLQLPAVFVFIPVNGTFNVLTEDNRRCFCKRFSNIRSSIKSVLCQSNNPSTPTQIYTDSSRILDDLQKFGTSLARMAEWRNRSEKRRVLLYAMIQQIFTLRDCNKPVTNSTLKVNYIFGAVHYMRKA